MRPESDLRRDSLLFAPLLAEHLLSWDSVRHLCALLAEGHYGATARLCWAVRDEAQRLAINGYYMDQRVLRRARAALLATGQKADADHLAHLLDAP